MNAIKNEDNVRNFVEYVAENRSKSNNCCEDSSTVTKVQLLQIFDDLLNNKAFNKEYLENNNHINELEKAKKVLGLKLKNFLPKHILIYMIVNSVIIGAVASAITIQIIGKVKVLNYYILLLLGVTSIGLLCTSIKLLGEWREYLISNEEKESKQ